MEPQNHDRTSLGKICSSHYYRIISLVGCCEWESWLREGVKLSVWSWEGRPCCKPKSHSISINNIPASIWISDWFLLRVSLVVSISLTHSSRWLTVLTWVQLINYNKNPPDWLQFIFVLLRLLPLWLLYRFRCLVPRFIYALHVCKSAKPIYYAYYVKLYWFTIN